MSNQSIKPSGSYYGLAVLVFIVGLGAAGFLGYSFYTTLTGMTDSLVQVVVPGSRALTLSQTGTYTVFYERQSVVGNKVYSTGESLSGLRCSLVSRATGSEIPLSRSAANLNYTVGGRAGTSVLEFTITQPGTYEFSAAYDPGEEGPEVVLAIGTGVGQAILGSVGKLFGAIGSLFVSGIIALVIAVITFVKRQKAKKQLAGTTA